MRHARFIVKKIQAILWTWVANLSLGGKNPVHANSFTWLSKNTAVGTNVNFNGMRVFGKGTVTIGDNFHSGKNISLYTQSHNYEGTALPYDGNLKIYNIAIGDNVWLGDNVTIIGNVEIGEGAIIQVGSVVTQSIQPLVIAGGNPAKPFNKRNAEKYHKLKAENKFH